MNDESRQSRISFTNDKLHNSSSIETDANGLKSQVFPEKSTSDINSNTGSYSQMSKRRSRRREKSQDEQTSLPPFVQVAILRPGEVFGFRACLDVTERGPSVSLVSSDCDMLQINKKFFLKHTDDAIMSLIRTKTKPYPTQEEMVDRLDANVQWADYKRSVITDLLEDISISRSQKQ